MKIVHGNISGLDKNVEVTMSLFYKTELYNRRDEMVKSKGNYDQQMYYVNVGFSLCFVLLRIEISSQRSSLNKISYLKDKL